MGEAPFKLSEIDAPALARQLERLSPREREYWKAWLARHPVGLNYALQIGGLLEDLSRREARPLSELLDESTAFFDAQDLQPKELGRRLRDHLEERLHPHSRSHEADFRRLVKALGLSPVIEIAPPQNFEGRSFSLKIDFDSIDSLRKALEELRSNLESRDWSRLWDF